MDEYDFDSSVPDWLIEHPRLLSLFNELGIDYCCGGKSLRTACHERNLSVQDVSLRIRALTAESATRVERRSCLHP